MKKIRLGILGFSDGNGHPYSFSAIINGYNKKEFSKTKWTGILNYLEKRDASEICSLDAVVTHIWTQSLDLSKEISRCCYIDNVVESYQDMIGSIDGVIVARDDYEKHKILAEAFLLADIPVFIDKPLTLDKLELLWFKKYYEKGLLMSCSGLRYCGELDDIKKSLETFGDIRLIRAAVINGWEKYGVHMLDVTLGVWDMDVLHVECFSKNNIDSYVLEFSNGMILQIDTLGPDVAAFSYEVFGTARCKSYEIRDNFTSFKRTLGLFVKQIQTTKPALEWSSLNRSISILIAGQIAKKEGVKVKVNYE